MLQRSSCIFYYYYYYTFKYASFRRPHKNEKDTASIFFDW
jgi:hypothetical protein